jgi:putative acetyltransferase
MTVTIRRADLDSADLHAFLQAHLDDMEPTAPPESRHALDLNGLRRPGVRVWSAHLDGTLVGTVALAPVDAGHEELKSMRTDPEVRGRGIASALLTHALADASKRDIRRISLETGSMEFFAPARALYARHGFVPCAPFGAYVDDPASTFLTRDLPVP